MNQKIILLFSFLLMLSHGLHSQPGPSEIGLFVYSKEGKSLSLQKDIQLFSHLPNSGIKMNGIYYSYGEKPCHGTISLMCTDIIVESSVNIVSIVYIKDTMNIVIKDYSSFGYKLILDSVVFNNGWFELKNENKILYGEKIEVDNKMHLVHDSCFADFARVSKKYIIPSPSLSYSLKTESSVPDEKEEAEILVEQKTIVDSAGTKYIKYKYHFDGKEYSGTSALSKNTKNNSRIVVTIKRKEAGKVLSIHSYPNGY